MRVTLRKFAVVGLLTASLVGGVSVVEASASSVCDTGFRGQRAYDRQCLVKGRPVDGVRLWFDQDRRDRRQVCRSGNVRLAVRELVFDVAYDRFRNHEAVVSWASMAARWECGR